METFYAKHYDKRFTNKEMWITVAFLFSYIVQPRLSEHAGIRQKRSDNRGCLYSHIYQRNDTRTEAKCSDK